jgi:hypothetical protein
MALLPTELELTGSTVTNAQQKTRFAALRNFLADLLGTDSANKAAARTALGAVGLTGDETIADVKTFLASPVLPTPARFDSTTKAATTAFVQRALGNYQGHLDLTASASLTAADAGKYVTVSASGITLTLPSSAGLLPGAVFHIGAAIGGSYTLATDGTDALYTNSAPNVTSALVRGGCDVIWRGTFWQTRNEYDFSSAKSANGYTRLPNGLIIQWGSLTTSSAGDVSVSFPIAFPNALLTLVGTEYTGGGTAAANSAIVGLGSQSATGFVVGTYDHTGARIGDGIKWIAIGN